MNATQLPSLAVAPQPTDHAQGPEHARVTVVEYGDFQCPSCKVAATTPMLLMERFPNKVRFVFRHFPIIEAHPHAMLAAQASEAAAAQGKFWPMYHALFDNQPHLAAKNLLRYAADIGLELTRYAAEMDEQIYLQKVREQMEGARHSHIRATPTFFVNGVLQDVSFGMQALHDAVGAAVHERG